MLQHKNRGAPPNVYLIELNRNHPRRYDEDAVWECYSHRTGRTTRIGGGLAQVLEKYPRDYRLRLIAAPSVKTSRRFSP